MKGVLKYGRKGAGCLSVRRSHWNREVERDNCDRNVDVAKVIKEMESRERARAREERDKIQDGMIIFPYQSPPRRSQM